jgi:hypothetical protein
MKCFEQFLTEQNDMTAYEVFNIIYTTLSYIEEAPYSAKKTPPEFEDYIKKLSKLVQTDNPYMTELERKKIEFAIHDDLFEKGPWYDDKEIKEYNQEIHDLMYDIFQKLLKIDDVRKEIIKQHPDSVQQFKDPPLSKELQLFALSLDPSVIKYIKDLEVLDKYKHLKQAQKFGLF